MTTRASSSSRAQAWGRRHPRVATALAVALLGFVLGLDVQRLDHVLHRVPAGAADPVLLLGGAAGVALVAYAGWLLRSSLRAEQRGLRWWYPVWLGLVPFALGHPRRISTVSASLDVTALGRFCLVFSVVVLAACVPALALRVVRMPGGRASAPTSTGTAPSPTGCAGPAEVWHVRDRGGSFTPYFVARCACEWLGPTRDEAAGDGQAKAFEDARTHTAHVQLAVVQPLD